VKKRSRRDEREGEEQDCIRSEDPRPSSMTGAGWAGPRREHDWDGGDAREFRASLRGVSMKESVRYRRRERGGYAYLPVSVHCHSDAPAQHDTQDGHLQHPWLSYGVYASREQSGRVSSNYAFTPRRCRVDLSCGPIKPL
jgi:hypothetical protein